MQALKNASACPTCHGARYVIFRQGEVASAKVCDCQKPCPHCGGTGHVYAEREAEFSERAGKRKYEVLAPCACTLLDERVAQYARVGVPAVLAHATLENFEPFNAAHQHALTVAKAFAHAYVKGKGGKGFILSGPVGSGKSHLLGAALSHIVLESGASAKYTEISLLYSTIRRGFQEGKSGGEIIQPLAEYEVLAIDELGRGRGSPFELETMDELIARRYNAGRTTLFATNYSLSPEGNAARGRGHVSTEKLTHASRESEMLVDRVGARIYSRLSEMCEFAEIAEAPDKRRTLHDLGTARPPKRR